MLDQFRLAELVKPFIAIRPGSYTAGTTNGPAQSTAGFSGALFTPIAGDLGASATWDVKIQESDDGSTGWTDVPNSAITQLTADDQTPMIDVKLTPARKAWLRAVSVVATATSGVGVMGQLYRPSGMPGAYPIAQAIATKFC
ncbi:MAG: hypothetical protein SF069_02985 [Phycisphaerae bacterium]|nr:hypothetical protein [Phycisphaerae bacterium]